MQTHQPSQSLNTLTLGAIGVVYGDIGTSPLYTIKEIFNPNSSIPLDNPHIVGGISCVLWLLMLVVTLKYVLLVLRADNKGEGGILTLLALALSFTKQHPTKTLLITGLGMFGAALFYGDSVLTPAISVLSAVEGLSLITPSFSHYIVPLSIIILFGLFIFQKHGTATVGRLFGPIIVVWFLTLAGVGIQHILAQPAILAAINPLHAIHFLAERGPQAFITIGAVVLAVTGAEALYADMGHFGRPAIRIAWTGLVFPALAINYLGQGALLMSHPEAIENPFYFAFPNTLLVPAVILATLATIIASQAVISGAFSITRQAIQLGYLPRMLITHTSESASGQIYLPMINWLLLCLVILTVFAFGNSSAIASAYGIAVTGTMLITTVLSFFIVYYQWKYPLWVASSATLLFLLLDAVLLASCSIKFFSGGWFPVVFAIALMVTMCTWKTGRQLLRQHLMNNDPKLQPFINAIATSQLPRVDRTAIFLSGTLEIVPQALMHNLKHNQVLHQHNLIVTVVFAETPIVEASDRSEYRDLGYGFWQVVLRFGFMESPNIPQALSEMSVPNVKLDPFSTSYFVSRETVIGSPGGAMAKWRDDLFALMLRNASSVVNYFHLPHNGVIELGTRVPI